MNEHIKYIISFILLKVVILLSACVQKPTAPQDFSPSQSNEGIYILCEGIWGMNNATLSKYNPETDVFSTNFYESVNPGLKLGDIANDIVIYQNKALIAVSTSNTVEIINLQTGLSLGRVLFEDRGEPRKIAVVNDTLAYITRLSGHCVSRFNPATLQVFENINVGPAPEGITFSDGKLYVVNSGFGDYLANHPKASTISIIDIRGNIETANIATGANPTEIIINEKLRTLYVSYNNLPSLSERYDSLGGIIEYELNTMKILRHWRAKPRSLNINTAQDTLFFINDNNLAFIPLNKSQNQITIAIANPNRNEQWYSLGISPNDGSLWIGNARNFSVAGEIIIYKNNRDNNFLKTFKTGINPNKIVFY